MQVNVFQGIITPLFIREIDVVEVNSAVRDVLDGLFRIRHVGLLVDDLRDAGRAGGALGKLDEDHGQHHQGGQHGHDVAEQRSQLARRQTPLHNEMRTEPAQGDDARVYDEIHHRAVQSHQRLRFHIEREEADGGLVELGHLMALPHESLHYADGIDILLHDAVHGIHLQEDLLEQPCGMCNQEREENAQHHHGNQENDAQPLMDQEAHRQGRRHVERRPEGSAEQHLESVLDAGHVRGHPRHKPRGGKLVDIGERETLDVFVHGQTQIRRKAGAAVSGEPAGQNAEHKAEARDTDHHRPVLVHIRQTPRANALVNDGRRHIRNQHAHDNLERRPQRRQQSRGPVLLDLFQYRLEHGCKDNHFLLSLIVFRHFYRVIYR